MKKVIGECRLCKENKELQLSHIVPKFVGRWLKNTSASGHLRNIVHANVRIQDLAKDHLLCKDCEGIFSAFEKKFAEKIFSPFHDKQSQFHYDTWLQKFLISLNWRVGISGINTNVDISHPLYGTLQDTLEKWRLFLLDKSPSPGSNKNHMIFIGINNIKEFNKVKFDHSMNTRFLRSVDFATVADVEEDRLFIYTAITGIAFVSQIHPSSFNGWTNETKITKRGTIKTLQRNDDFEFGHFISQRISSMNHLIDTTLSEKQLKVITDQATKDVYKTLDSKSLGLLNQIIKIIPPDDSDNTEKP